MAETPIIRSAFLFPRADLKEDVEGERVLKRNPLHANDGGEGRNSVDTCGYVRCHAWRPFST